MIVELRFTEREEIVESISLCDDSLFKFGSVIVLDNIIGLPQLMQDGARSEICLLQSGHLINAIIHLFKKLLLYVCNRRTTEITGTQLTRGRLSKPIKNLKPKNCRLKSVQFIDLFGDFLPINLLVGTLCNLNLLRPQLTCPRPNPRFLPTLWS